MAAILLRSANGLVAISVFLVLDLHHSPAGSRGRATRPGFASAGSRKRGETMTGTLKFGGLFGRILLAAIFLMAGTGKIMDPAGTKQYMAAHGMPMIDVLYVAAI